MFDLNQVTSVYSGRKGCACGCRGKYSYASQYADTRPSYYTENQGVNDRVVKTLLNKVERLLHDPQSPVARVLLHDDWLAVDMQNDRTYTVYFN